MQKGRFGAMTRRRDAQRRGIYTVALLAMLGVLLSACGSGESRLGAGEETVEIGDSDADQTVHRTRPYELILSGKTITIAENDHVTRFTISGSNNLVNVSAGVLIDELVFSGNDNSVLKAPTSVINTVVYGSTSGNTITP